MPIGNERFAVIENRIEEQHMQLDDVRDAVRSLEARVDRFEARMDERFSTMDQRFSNMDQRFSAMEQRFSTIDQRFSAIDQRFVGVDQRFVGIETRLDTMNKMMWALLIGIATSVIATLGGIIAALVRS